MRLEQAIAAVRFDPTIPWALLAALAGLCVIAILVAALRRARGTIWRGLAFAAVLLWLSGPRLVQETRQTLPDIGLLVIDESASMAVGNRAELATAARQAIEAQGRALPDLDLRVIRVRDGVIEGDERGGVAVVDEAVGLA